MIIIPLLIEQAHAVTIGMADSIMVASAGESAVKENSAIASGVDFYQGICTNKNVANALDYNYQNVLDLI